MVCIQLYLANDEVLDMDGSGTINFEEFLHGTLRLRQLEISFHGQVKQLSKSCGPAVGGEGDEKALFKRLWPLRLTFNTCGLG